MSDDQNNIITPCTGICTIDDTKGWCIGCGRSRKEIAQWSKMNNQDKLVLIRKDLKNRLKEMNRWPIKPK